MIGTIFADAGNPIEIKGTAYDFGHSVSAIQFSLDGGEHWTTHECKDTKDHLNLTWTLVLTLDEPGSYKMDIRSVNDRGDVSPECAHVHIEVS
ncbi:MAG: molybdopterin-binding protein [Eggerthellaceae bacterium]|nr:molybdopterin-binding protein [Eggerthellaceae bacterium]